MEDEKLARDEHFQQLMALKDKVKQLDQVIREGEHAEDFRKSHPFWPVLELTLKSLRRSYNVEAHKASRDSRAEISHFLGREEAISDVFSVLSDFSTRADAAEEEKKVAEDQIRELHSILETPGSDGSNLADVGGSM